MLRGQNLVAFRAERLVFSGVDFSLTKGAALLLVGPNGSGKSTLLRLLAGLLPPAAGALTWRDDDIRADLASHARRLAYLGHQDAIKPALTVRANLGPASRAVALASLDRLGLAALADLPARLLSAGQRRRLALARLCRTPKPLWLLDEPTLGLDDASVTKLGAVIAAHRAAGGMVVAATHLPLPLPGAETCRLAG